MPNDVLTRHSAMPPGVGRVHWLGVASLTKKEIWRFGKVWNQTILAPVITTLLFLAVLKLSIGGTRGPVEGITFDRFIAPGLIMMAVVQNAFANTSSSLMLSKIQGVIVDLLMPPFKGGEIALSLVAGGMARGLAVSVTVTLAIYCFVPFTLHSPGLMLFYLLFSSMLMATLGVLAGIIAQSFDQMAALTNYLVTPLSFLSGTFYSIEQLPPAWRHVSHANPFFYMIDGFRFAMTGHADGDIRIGMAVLLVLNILFFFLAAQAFGKGWRLKT